MIIVFFEYSIFQTRKDYIANRCERTEQGRGTPRGVAACAALERLIIIKLLFETTIITLRKITDEQIIKL